MTGQRLFGRLVSDSALYGLAAAVAKALALLTVPYLTRALSPTGYGIADLATSTAALVTLVALFSGDIPATRQVGLAEDERSRRRVVSSYVWATAVVSLGVAVILVPLAPVIAGRLWDSPEQTSLATLSLVLVPVSATQAALAQTQRIRARPGVFAILALVDLLAQLGLAVAFVAAGLGPAGVVVGFIVGSFVGLLAALVAARDTVSVTPDWWTAWRIVIQGVPFLPHVTTFVLADWAVRSIVANEMGPGTVAELGLAIRVASVLSLVGAAFAMAWGPLGLARARDIATARLFGRVLAAYGAASVALALILAAIGPELLPFVAGPGYEGSVLILPGYALAFAMAGTEYVLVIAAGVADRSSRVATAATVGAFVQIAAAMWLVPQVGVIAIGLVAVFGRAVSFSILLAGVRGSIVVPIARFVGLACLALLAFAAMQVAIGQDPSWVAARWGGAFALTAITILLAVRRLQTNQPMAA